MFQFGSEVLHRLTPVAELSGCVSVRCHALDQTSETFGLMSCERSVKAAQLGEVRYAAEQMRGANVSAVDVGCSVLVRKVGGM